MKQSTRIYRILLCVFMLAASLSLGSSIRPAQAAGGIIVDDDGKQCHNRTTDKIADALAMAPADGARITVCAGIYVSGPLFVSNVTNLKLIARKGVRLVPDVDPFGAEMITVENSTNVTVQGFTIDGQGHVALGGNHTAIYYNQSSGTVTKNTIVNWHTSTYPIGPDAASIWIAGSGAGMVTVSRNMLIDMDYYGIVLIGEGTVKVTGNRISTRLPVGPVFTTGIYALDGMTGSITGNKVSSDKLSLSSNAFRGIRLEGVSGMKVSGNTVKGAGKGIQIQATTLPTNGNIISGNKLYEVETGIWLLAYGSTESVSADSNKITGNRIRDKMFRGYYGILVSADGENLPPTVYGSLQNETVKGNTIINFNEEVTTNQGVYGSITGVFGPNK